MKSLFKDIFQYHRDVNQEIGELLLQNREKISERSIPLLSHNINAHKGWNYRINGQLVSFPFDDLDIEDALELDKENLIASMAILENRDLNEVIHYQGLDGTKFQNTICDILFHVANHHTHHRGQIISDLRQNGIAPPVTDYIFKAR